jgi:hypothetical protein
MEYVGLVSSINGLGHTRRLSQLALSFQDKGFIPFVFATTKQIKNLELELNNFGRKVNFIEISSYGIDGPVWMQNGCIIEKPNKRIINFIDKCKFIISDNVFWPARYNQNFVLFGHFNWLDFWEFKGYSNFSNKIYDIYLEETQLANEISLYLSSQDFQLKSIHITREANSIKLLKYKSDIFLPSKFNDRTVWISNGTTEINKNLVLDIIPNYKLEFIEKETFHLLNSPQKPSLVFGRPGLGTIRDCLAAGIPFIPIAENLDPELQSNIDNLSRLGPILTIDSRTKNLAEIANQLISDSFLVDKWQNIWPKISQSCDSVCELILNSSLK